MSFHVNKSHGGVINLFICLLIVLVIVYDSFVSVSVSSKVFVFILCLSQFMFSTSGLLYNLVYFLNTFFNFFLWNVLSATWQVLFIVPYLRYGKVYSTWQLSLTWEGSYVFLIYHYLHFYKNNIYYCESWWELVSPFFDLIKAHLVRRKIWKFNNMKSLAWLT